MAPLILNLSICWRLLVSFISGQFNPVESRRYPLDKKLDVMAKKMKNSIIASAWNLTPVVQSIA